MLVYTKEPKKTKTSYLYLFSHVLLKVQYFFFVKTGNYYSRPLEIMLSKLIHFYELAHFGCCTRAPDVTYSQIQGGSVSFQW